MAKKRIHQLAKELEVASADILHNAQELGIEVKTASSGLTPEEEELVKISFEEQKSVEKEDSSTTDNLDTDEKIEVKSEITQEEKEINIFEVTEGSTPGFNSNLTKTDLEILEEMIKDPRQKISKKSSTKDDNENSG